jgi:hypothetical protein
MRLFGRLLRAIFLGRERNTLSLRIAAEEELRKKIRFWEHQATLYDLAGLGKTARRCRAIANEYRVKVVALVFHNEAA